jgi:VIT1/CCC1 family predicted Fe2+/Mn2+ transporter
MQNNNPAAVAANVKGTDATGVTIRTSEPGWLAQLAKAYRNREQVVVIDDANAGIDPSSQTLLDMGLKTGLSRKEWTAVLIAGGMTIFGAVVIILAVLDPDPTSKLGLLIASGAVLTLGGGFSAIRILTKHKPPKVRVSRKGIEIEWD